MQIKLLKLTNCLGIEEKEIKIGKITLIDGASESGKTSIIDSIRKGLKNEDVRPKFVKGEGNGIVFMQFDENLEVTRTVKPDNKSTLKISQNGMTPNQPQSFLNGLLGENDFAPIDWLKKKDKEQTEDLLKILDIKVSAQDVEKLTGAKPNIDYTKHGLVVCEELEKFFMEERKSVNADMKSFKANIEDAESELPQGYEADKYRDVKLNDLFDEISNAENINNLLDKAKERIENSNENIKTINEDHEQRLADLKAEFTRRKEDLIYATTQKIDTEKKRLSAAEQYISENTVIDTDGMRASAKEIETGQSYLRTFDKLVDYRENLEISTKESIALTNILTKVRNLPAELLAGAESPIEGMGIENGNVTINGLPIKNLSDGAKMQLAIKIAKATSKDLKLILLNGFEQLNWEIQKKMFQEMQEDEYQYIITRVMDGPLSISHIKDGYIANIETGEIVEIEGSN